MLIFFSGSDQVPTLEFPPKTPMVSFLTDPFSKFCTASTCEINLRLPTCHGEDHEAFKEAMHMAILNNDGFGGV